MNTQQLIAVLTALTISLNLLANETVEHSLDTGTIDDQFGYLMEESNNYKDYKVVKSTWLHQFKSHISDSLSAVQKELNESNAIAAKQGKEISELKNNVKGLTQDLAAVNQEKNSITFFGVMLDKPIYKGIMWSIVGILFTVGLFFIFQFKRSHVITSQAREVLSQTQEEFETFRKKAREREQVLKRELQDELNRRYEFESKAS